MDSTIAVDEGYRVDSAGTTRYFPSNSRLRRQASPGGTMLVISGKGFTSAFPVSSQPRVFSVKRSTLSAIDLSRVPLRVNQTCSDSSSCDPGCDASYSSCGTCSDCIGEPSAGPEDNPDGTSICIFGQCGVDDNGDTSGIATFRSTIEGVSCNVNLVSLDMDCEYGDVNSGGDRGLDLFRSYSYFGGSHHLDCNPWEHHALVWVTFMDPAATSTIVSIVPGGEEGEWSHASAFVTGTSMSAQYKGLIPLRPVAHCSGTD
jgi:hypothetical protein